MIGFISIFVGIFMVLIAVLLIRREFERTLLRHPLTQVNISDENAEMIKEQLLAMEKTVDQMNGSFYDIVSDLEGKYSVHDKEMELLQEELEHIKARMDMVALRTKKIEGNSEKSSIPPVVEKQPVTHETNIVEVKTDSKTTSIKKLRTEGLSVNQIAKELDIGVGEVVLHLRKDENS